MRVCRNDFVIQVATKYIQKFRAQNEPRRKLFTPGQPRAEHSF